MTAHAKRELPSRIAAVLAAAKTPAHASSTHVTDQLKPILDVALAVQKQIAEHRYLLFTAQLEHPEHDGQLEHLHQSLVALETDAKNLVDSARSLRTSMRNYERYAANYETMQGTPFPPDGAAAK